MIGFGLILLLDEIFTRDLYYWSASKGWKPYNWLQPMLASADANIKGKTFESWSKETGEDVASNPPRDRKTTNIGSD